MGLFFLIILILVPSQSFCNATFDKICEKAYEFGSFVVSPALSVIKHFEDHGKGEAAIEQLDQQNKITRANAQAMENIAASNEHLAQAGNDVAINLKDSNATQKERNEILRGIKQDVETAGKIVGIVIGTGVIIKTGYEFVNFAKESISPSPETKLRKRLVVKNLELLDAEDDLNRCLVNHEEDEQEHSGLPRACKQVSKFYAAVAGQEALDRVTHAFSRNHRQV